MNEPDLENFAQRLTSVVQDFGPSRAASARAFGIGDTTLKSYMSGATEPGVTELRRICDATGYRLEWLVLGRLPRRVVEGGEPPIAYAVDPNWYHRDLVVAVVSTLEEELSSRSISPPPGKRADLVGALCHLSKRSGEVDRDTVRLLLDVSVKGNEPPP